MNIVSLKIKNFLSISDVEIKPGQINQIVGKNNQGKTTILKAIEFAIKGSADGSLVKFGEEAAEVTVELSDATNIRRRISSEGRQSVAVSKDGFKAQQPQTLLDGLFESSSFNPIDLLDHKRRADAILTSIEIKLDEAKLQAELNDSTLVKVPLPPLDYKQHGLKVIDQAYKYFYQRRAEANRDAENKKKRWQTYFSDLPQEDQERLTREQVQIELDIVASTLRQAEEALTTIRGEHASARKAQERLNKYCAMIDAIDDDIAKAEAHIQALRARRDEGQKFVDQAKLEVAEVLPDDKPHLEKFNNLQIEYEKVKAKFAEVDRFESIGKQRAMVDNMKKDYDEAQTVADGLSRRVEALAGPIKKKLMEAAEMPITGLTYQDGEFRVDGVPVDNLSASKALKLAVGVARKLAKKTKVICIDGAEQLDEQSYVALIKEIENDGFTYFITRVGEPYHSPSAPYVEMKDGQAVN